VSAMIGNPLLLPDEGYNISRSVRLRSSASAYLDRTFTTPTSRRIFTLSAWTKRGALGTTSAILGNAGTREVIGFFGSTTGNGDALHFRDTSGGAYEVTTTAVFRDPSAWYHVVVAFDTTQATASNRVKMYVNGVQQTAFAVATYPSQNADLNLNSAVVHAIGRRGDAAAYYFDGYITEINFIDGQALTPSSFGETDSITGVWKPKKYTGTYGTNGFFLNFSDNSNNTAATIGKDYSGNGNNWTPNNISVTSGSTYDSMLDVPTQWADGGNGRGNYCVMNPLEHRSNRITPTDGNITVTLGAGSNAYFGSRSTMGVSTGKWYWEVNVVAKDAGAGQWLGIGIVLGNVNWPAGNGLGANSGGYEYLNDGFKWGAGSASAYGATYNNGDVIGVALDADAQTLTFYKNGVSQGTAFSSIGSGEPWFPTAEIYRSTGTTQTLATNFGQRPFSYTPPSGFKALNTLNLPAPTILKGNQYFDATTYTGNGSTLSVTNSGSMQPDLVWYKSRGAARDHGLFDSVRGATAYLGSNLTNAEQTVSGVTAFNSNGFTLGSAIGGNNSGEAFVGWQWKEGATQGFDIVTYTGNGTSQNISHSLGVAPKMIITKPRSNGTDGWAVYHASIGAGGALQLETTVATQVTGIYWNSTAPTSSVFSVGSANRTNGSGYSMVAYLFSEVAGFSRFGSYTGNGSTDGPFVFCGFRPRWILRKGTVTAGVNWSIHDTARGTTNVITSGLLANTSGAETSIGDVDVTANGFKMRSSSFNDGSEIYIFAAFAEHPFKNALAR